MARRACRPDRQEFAGDDESVVYMDRPGIIARRNNGEAAVGVRARTQWTSYTRNPAYTNNGAFVRNRFSGVLI